MIVAKLQDLFRLLFSDPEQAERFAEDPEAVLSEGGIDCDVADQADALPLAATELPPEQAAAGTGSSVAARSNRGRVRPCPPFWLA